MSVVADEVTMTVREATAADAEAVRRVHRASIEGLGPAAYSPEQVTAWARGCESTDYTAGIESKNTYFVVAERKDENGDVVGFGSLSFDVPTNYEVDADAEVTGVYVHPSVAREGIGTELLRTLERTARSEGVERLGLSASLNAVAFYAHRGYERIKTYDHEFSSQVSTGVTGRVVEMTRYL